MTKILLGDVTYNLRHPSKVKRYTSAANPDSRSLGTAFAKQEGANRIEIER